MNNKFHKPPVIAGLFGTILEWYDFSVYVYLAIFIAKLFFPEENKYLGLILTYSIFAIGYLMRPIGGFIFGHFGDRYGRNTTFVATIMLMSIATLLIGFLPTYYHVGILAPCLLVLLRLLQGIAIGGEMIGTLTYFYEVTIEKKRGFVTTLIWCGSGLGILLGSIVSSILLHFLSDQQLLTWGWRLPFFFGIVTGIVGYLLRRQAGESAAFLELKQKNEIVKFPLLTIFREHKVQLLKIFIIFIPGAIAFYLIFVFMPTYANKFINLPLAAASIITTAIMTFFDVFTPFLGWLSDKIGRKLLLVSGLIGLVLFTLPLYYFIQHGTLISLLIAQFIFAIIIALYSSALIAFTLELVPTQIRFSIMGIGYNACYSIFGGTTPLIATYLIYKSGNNLFPAFYLIAAAAIALITVFFCRKA
ncbi:MAG: MFS transporter [Gammaproteobacteria bacterium]|nr:MFS transporter [Gammaproteobacteria bacterium]